MQFSGYRLSPSQKRVWLLQQESSAYRAQCELELEGILDTAKLKAALKAVVNRHEILRTVFCRPSSLKFPAQVAIGSTDYEFNYVDLSTPSSQPQEDELDRHVRQWSAVAFDFERGPLLKCILFGLGDQRHRLLLALPSLCADTQTLANLCCEIMRNYISCNAEEIVTDDVMQYIQFSEWQNSLLESDEDEAGRAYWRRRDFSALNSMRLPMEVHVLADREFKPQTQPISFRPGLWSEISELADRLDTSVAVLMLASWYSLIWRLTGTTDLMAGLVCDGRPFDILQEAFGLFAKSIPVQCRFEPHYRFNEIVERLSESAAESFERQEYFSLDSIPDFEQNGHTPFLPLSFEFIEHPDLPGADGLRAFIADHYCCFDRFSLKLSCIFDSRSPRVRLDYDQASYNADSAKQIASHFATLLDSILENPFAEVVRLEVLSDDENRQLLLSLNNTVADFGDDRCLRELFEEQAGSTPDRVALVFEDHFLTYFALNALSSRIACFLRNRGASPEVLIGLFATRSLETIIALLGILKTGAAYVPMEPDNPKVRLSAQIADMRAMALIVQSEMRDHLTGIEADYIDIGEALSSKNELPDESGPVHNLDHPAYVIYTSGSTGAPKGVIVTQRNLLNYTFAICEQMGLRPLEANRPLHFATISSIAADLGNTAVFPSLLTGGCLHILNRDLIADASLLADCIALHSIDVLKIVPSHLSTIIAANDDGRILPRRHLILGGESFPTDLLRRIRGFRGDCRVMNHYGPTETTIGSITFAIAEEADRYGIGSSTVPVGCPIANTQIHILDTLLRPVPPGIPGQLFIGGAGVTRGYLNAPHLTAEKFVPDPFSNGEGRLYKTGDLARRLTDGNIEFLGRVDHQVKIRGYRVELGEIEAVVMAHPAVRAASVILKEDKSGEKRIVAYYVADSRALHSADLRTFLLGRLPAHMVPSTFVSLSSLPLTPSGKVDRAALPEPDCEMLELRPPFIAPTNPVQECVAGIWAELLGLEHLGIHDNFFELGGHSLLATQVISRLRKAFQVELHLRHLFDQPTIAGLSETIEAARWAMQTPSTASDAEMEEGEL
ncbi:MAG: amino acid adenylation domain-containing protein [Blastocatellia bacterium]